MNVQTSHQPLPWFKRGFPIFDLALRDLVLDRKFLIIALLGFFPLIVPLLSYLEFGSSTLSDARSMYEDLIIIFTGGFYSLIVSLLVSSAAISEEKTDKTISYLLCRPISRIEILLWKFVAYIVVVTSLLWFHATLFYIGTLSFAGLNQLVVIDNLTLLLQAFVFLLGFHMVYGAIFFILCVWLEKPLFPGLLVAFGEVMLSSLFIATGSLGGYSISYHVAVFRDTVFDRTPNLVSGWDANSSLILMPIMIIASLGLAMYLMRKKDFA